MGKHEGSTMGAYRGYAALAGQPESGADVEVRLGDSRLVLSAGQTLLGNWPLAEVTLARRLDGFVLRAEGDELVLSLRNAEGFWAEATKTDGKLADTVETLELRTPGDEPTRRLHPAETQPLSPRWWRLWDPVAWRTWQSRRRAWKAYTAEAQSLASRLDQTSRLVADTEESLATAKRSLAWATGVGPRHVPVAKAAAETGLGTVPGVTLLEVGPANGGDVWVAVDSGDAHFTDRRLVFSGTRRIEFRFEDLTAVESRPDGLFVSVSSHTRPHLLGGDSERLMAVLEACRSVAEGGLPSDPFESDIARLEAMAGRARTDLESLTTARSELIAPPRPFSPAWMPLSLALVLIGALASLP